jgi:hypothetical protein
VKSVSSQTFKNKYLGKRLVIIDTGSSSNANNSKLVKQSPDRFIQETEFKQEYDTANGISETSAGIRVQIGTWDGPCEWLMMEDSPDLLSVGERCMFAGFTFVWVYNKYPCFISYGGQYIVIFDIDNTVPVWGPHLEEGQDFFGTYWFNDNAFLERCGIYINPKGEVCLNLAKLGVDEPEFGCYGRHQVCGASHQMGQRKRKGGDQEDAAPTEVPAVVPDEPGPIEELGPPSGLWFDVAAGGGIEEVVAEDGVPPPPAPIVDMEANRAHRTRVKRSFSQAHLMNHDEFIPECPGCQAKAREKRKFKSSFQRDHPKHANEIGMDQVGLTDMKGTLGIGKDKYAIVMCKSAED